MANALKLEVILESVDKMTAPIRSALSAGRDLDDQTADLRKELLTLNKTQKNMTAFKNLKKQSKVTTEELDAARKKAHDLAIQFKNTETPSKTLTAQFERSRNAVNRLKDKQQQEIRSLSDMRVKLNEAGVSTQRLSKAQKQLDQDTAKATKALDNQANKLKAVQAQQKAMNRLHYQKNRSMQMASNMTIAGAGGVATGRKMVQATMAPAVVAMDFEEQMSKVQALTRLDKSNPAQAAKMTALKQQALDLGASTSYSASEAAGAQSFLAMAGFDPDKIMKSMPGMLSLAKAAGTELAQTADISSNILSGFRLEADQMGRVGDVLTATFTRSNVDLSMLGESMKYAAPVAAELGVSLEETAAMAGLLGNVGIQSTMAGTAMRAIFNRMSAPPKMAREALEDISVKTTDAAGNMRSVPEILAEIAKKTETMGNAQRMAIFKAVAGAEAGSAMATLVAKEGAAGISKFTEVLTQSGGEADRVAKIMSDNTKGHIKEAQSAWEGMQITLGTMLMPTLNSLILKVTELTRSVQKWAQENPETAATIMKVALGLGVLIAVMGGLSMVLAAVLGPMVMMRFSFGMLGIKAGGLGSIFKMLGSGLMMLARVVFPLIITAVRALGMAMLANPIGVAVAVIAGLAYLIYKNWDTVKQWLLTFWDAIKPYFTAAWEWIKVLWSWSPLGLVINNWGSIVTWFKGLPDMITSALSGLAKTMMDIGGNIMDSMKQGIKDKIAGVLKTVTGFASDITKKVKGVLGIHSPSRVFRNDIAGNAAESTGLGFEDKKAKVMQIVHKFGKIIPTAALAGMASVSMPASAQIQSIHKAEAKQTPISSHNAQQVTQTFETHIHATPGMDEHALSELVEQKLRQMLNQAQDNRRGYLFDGADH